MKGPGLNKGPGADPGPWMGPGSFPGLALLGLPRLESASLALPAPRNNSPAAFGGRAARSGAAVVAGAGKASEADAKRGEPSKAKAWCIQPMCFWDYQVWKHSWKYAL